MDTDNANNAETNAEAPYSGPVTEAVDDTFEDAWHDDMYFKILGQDGRPVNGGHGQWFLPENGKPGKWMPIVYDVRACAAGYHLTYIENVVSWCESAEPRANNQLYVYWAEGRGDCDEEDTKSAHAEARTLKLVVGPEQWYSLVGDFIDLCTPAWERAFSEAVDFGRDFARKLSEVYHGKYGHDAASTERSEALDALEAEYERFAAAYYEKSKEYTMPLSNLRACLSHAASSTVTGFSLFYWLLNDSGDIGAQIANWGYGAYHPDGTLRTVFDDFLRDRLHAMLRSEELPPVVPVAFREPEATE